MVDRYLLRYFLAVVDCGSFSRAAKQVNVSQPSLSVAIGKLEKMLGTALFERTAKRVHITEAGSRFAVHARRIENDFNVAVASVAGMTASRELKLGVISTVPMSLVAAAVNSARRAGGDERIQIVPGNERELLQRLGRGQIDAALSIVRPDSDRFAQEVLFCEHYALALWSGHPLAARPSIAAEELADNPMIVRRHCEVLAETSRHFTERGVRPFFAFRGTNDDQILTLIQSGLGLTVMPASYSQPGVARPLLSGFALKRRIGLLFAGHADHLRHTASPMLEALRARYRARSKPS